MWTDPLLNCCVVVVVAVEINKPYYCRVNFKGIPICFYIYCVNVKYVR